MGTVKERSRKCKVSKQIDGLGFVPLQGTESEKTPGVYGTGKKVLALLEAKTDTQKEALKLLLERSKVDKIIEMFCAKNEGGGLLNKIAPDGRIHPQFNQAVTVTGRLSSKDPKRIGVYKVCELRETL